LEASERRFPRAFLSFDATPASLPACPLTLDPSPLLPRARARRAAAAAKQPKAKAAANGGGGGSAAAAAAAKPAAAAAAKPAAAAAGAPLTTLAQLEAALAGKSYVGGFVASRADREAFDALGAPAPGEALGPNVERWARHMRSFSAAERAAWA
jgi:hypothetical protein